MKAIPTSKYDFAHLIEHNMNYVDKTDFLHRLVVSEDDCFFLSRPRRFGKSLMISTLSYIFEGRRDLFAGLKIDELAYDWQIYPVVHLNMADMKGESVQIIEKSLFKSLKEIAAQHSISIDPSDKLGDIFHDILKWSAAQSPTGKVVLLIDEYDAPMVNCIGEPHFEEVRKLMAGFYEKIKSANAILRFTMMTGVTRFPKVSIFSALNHMTDISMDLDYATMLGYTQVELEFYFGERMEELAQKHSVTVEVLKQRIKVWYNGYRFHPLAATLYNPVSIGRYFSQGEFKTWWFDTGSPTFLIEQLREKSPDYFAMLHKPVTEGIISSFNPSRLDARALLFQTGYLTIADAEEDEDMGWFYTLGFPNKEVELSLSTHLVAELGAAEMTDPLYSARTLAQLIRRGDTGGIVEALHAHFSAIPYDALALDEGNFKSLLFFLFRMAGVIVSAEHYTNKGRVDMVIEAPEHYYIFEYKYNQSAAEAMAQIHKKGYYEQFRNQGKQIHLVALNYEPEQRNIGDDWVEEVI